MSDAAGLDVHVADVDAVLATPGGSAVALRVERVTVRWDGEVPAAVLVEATVDALAWAWIDAGALLHLDPEARGPLLGGGLDPSKPVHIDAVLDADAMEALDALDAAAIADVLRGGDPDHPIRDAQRWWALVAHQDVEPPAGLAGELSAGFRTVWSDAPPPAGIASVLEHALALAGLPPSREATDGGEWIVRFQTDDAIGLAIAREEARQALVYLVATQMCPQERRDELARLAALVNFDLPIGCLETSLDAGLTRVRTSADLPAGELSLALARDLVDAACHLAGAWFPAVRAVIAGADARDALGAT